MDLLHHFVVGMSIAFQTTSDVLGPDYVTMVLRGLMVRQVLLNHPFGDLDRSHLMVSLLNMRRSRMLRRGMHHLWLVDRCMW